MPAEQLCECDECAHRHAVGELAAGLLETSHEACIAFGCVAAVGMVIRGDQLVLSHDGIEDLGLEVSTDPAKGNESAMRQALWLFRAHGADPLTARHHHAG